MTGADHHTKQQKIVRAATVRRTIQEIARIAQCEMSYAATVIRRLDLPYRKLVSGGNGPMARQNGLNPGESGLRDRAGEYQKTLDGRACDHLKVRLEMFHPLFNGTPREDKMVSPFINPHLDALLGEVERVIGEMRRDSLLDVSDASSGGRALPVTRYALLRLRDAKAAYDRSIDRKPSGRSTNAIPEASSGKASP